jgi:hypothetical protein
MGCGSTPVLALVLLLFGLSSCQNKSAVVQVVAVKPSNAVPELTVDNMNAQSYDGSGLKWNVHGQSSLVYSSKNLMKIIAFDATMFDNGQKSTHIVADQCLKNTASESAPQGSGMSEIDSGLTLDIGDMYLKGNVVVISTDGNKLSTDWLHYHKKTELITSSRACSFRPRSSHS